MMGVGTRSLDLSLILCESLPEFTLHRSSPTHESSQSPRRLRTQAEVGVATAPANHLRRGALGAKTLVRAP